MTTADELHTLTGHPADTLKMLRETYCVAATGIGLLGRDDAAWHVARLQRLIDAIDRLRPIGPDGKHGDRHTPHCGCNREEVPA